MTNDESLLTVERVRGEPVPVEQKERIRRLVVAKGLQRAAGLLGCSKDTVAKAIAGLGVGAGTRALLTARLDERDKAGRNP
jgi:hypothetical protein